MDGSMFDGLFGALIFVGVLLGALIVGLIWLLFSIF